MRSQTQTDETRHAAVVAAREQYRELVARGYESGTAAQRRRVATAYARYQAAQRAFFAAAGN